MQEVYSIKLPGNPILGEGKPENQNHAIVFTRGNAIQTIDMNQVCKPPPPPRDWNSDHLFILMKYFEDNDVCSST